MTEECRRAIYSEDYLDYIVEDYVSGEETREVFEVPCYQEILDSFGIIYSKGINPVLQQRRGAILPRCFGTLSSEEMLEASGISRVQRLPGLDLNGQGILFGIIDTGAGV